MGFPNGPYYRFSVDFPDSRLSITGWIRSSAGVVACHPSQSKSKQVD